MKFLRKFQTLWIKIDSKFFYIKKNLILDKVFELIYDSDIKVKIAALKLIFNIFTKLS
jgi:hypothetical protein